MGTFVAQHKYSSNLIPNSSTTYWKISNVDKISESCCWTCMSFDTEVPLGADYISKWRISLYMENNVLYGRSKLISPSNEDVTHKINITVTKKGEKLQLLPVLSSNLIKNISISNTNCAKETSSRSKQPVLWKIISLDTNSLSEIMSKDNTLELMVETIVYGSYTSELE